MVSPFQPVINPDTYRKFLPFYRPDWSPLDFLPFSDPKKYGPPNRLLNKDL
jgi:hypothetical protein